MRKSSILKRPARSSGARQTHSYTHPPTPTHTHIYIHTHTHPHTHTYTYTPTHPPTHAQTYTHTMNGGRTRFGFSGSRKDFAVIFPRVLRNDDDMSEVVSKTYHRIMRNIEPMFALWKPSHPRVQTHIRV